MNATHLWGSISETHDSWLAGVVGLVCTCDDHEFSAASCGCAYHGDDNLEAAGREARAEIDAENAWLRAAEAPTADDLAFEQWEMGRISPSEYDRYYR